MGNEHEQGKYENPKRKYSTDGKQHHPGQELVPAAEPPGGTETETAFFSSSSYSAAADDDIERKTKLAPPPASILVAATEPRPPPFASAERRTVAAEYISGQSKACKVVDDVGGGTNVSVKVTEGSVGDGFGSSDDVQQVQPGAFAVPGANSEAIRRRRDDHGYDDEDVEVATVPDPEPDPTTPTTVTVTATATLVPDVDVVEAVPMKEDTWCRCLCDRRTKILVAVLVPALVASVALLVGFLVPWSELLSTDDGDGGGNPAPPSSSPPPVLPGPSRLEVMNRLVASMSPDGLMTLPDPSSPRGKALSYVVNDDGPDAPPPNDTDRLLQRYALATLYHGTNGEEWMDKCNFLVFAHECDWRSYSYTASTSGLGVRCDTQRHVVSILLPNNRLYGTLPPEIGLLTSLARLDLHGDMEDGVTINVNTNRIESTIPTEIGSLSALTHLDLSGNVLDGTVPTEIARLDNLVALRLSHNRLIGRIPPAIKDMPALELLSLAYNQLTGDVADFGIRCQYLMKNLNITCPRERLLLMGVGDGDGVIGRDLQAWAFGCSQGMPCCDPDSWMWMDDADDDF